MREILPTVGFVGLVGGLLGACMLVLFGCGLGYPEGSQRVYEMKCYSGERLVLEANVIQFAPGGGIKTQNTMWDVNRRGYVAVKNMACVYKPTGEWA